MPQRKLKQTADWLQTQFKRHFQSLMAVGVRGLSVVAGFLVTYLIGRHLGPKANGEYALITQTAMFLSIVAVGGLDLAAVRKFSEAVAKKLPLRRSSLYKILLYSFAFNIAIILLLVMGGHPMMQLLFKDDIPQGALLILIAIMISRTFTRMVGGVLRSQKSYILGQAIEVLFIPVAVSLVIMLGVAKSVGGILWMTAIIGMGVALFGILACLRYTAVTAEAHAVEMRGLLKIAAPLWGVAIFLNISDWYSLATAAAVLSVYDAGLYRIATQAGSVLSVVILSLFSVFSAQMAAAYAAGNRDAVADLCRTATRLSAAFVIPLAIVLFVFAEPLLGLFGPEFVKAATVMRVVVVGQAIYVVTGPAGLALAMTGHERVNLMVTLVSTIFLLIMTPVAAHQWGLIGISAFMGIAFVARNVASLIAMWKLEGINVMTGRRRPVKE